jgi:hypothetical protein
MTTNNITNNNSFGAGPPGPPFQIQNSTEGESTTSQVAKRKLEELQETNTDLAQQNPEGRKHRKIETRTSSDNNSFGAVPPGQYVQVQNSTEGESTTNRGAKRKLDEFQETNTDLAQQSIEGIKHQKIELMGPPTPCGIFPNEIYINIFSFLDFKTLSSLRCFSSVFCDNVHKTLEHGLRVMDPMVLNFIGKASETWKNFTMTVEYKNFNLNPIQTKFYSFYSLQPISPEFIYSEQIALYEWDDLYEVACVFLTRARYLTDLDLSTMFEEDDDKGFKANHSDFRDIMKTVSSSLERLDLSHNCLEVPTVLATLKTHDCAIKILSLECTFLQNEKSPTENKEFSTVNLNDLPRTLKSLNLDSLRNMNQSPSFQLTGDFPTSLTKLGLADNILSENSLLSLPSSLTYLNLSTMRTNNRQTPFFKGSNFSRIKEFSFDSLVTLHLSNNQLTEVKEIMSKLSSSLEHLNLSNNYLEVPAVLATLKSHGFALKTLFLHYTLLPSEELPTVDLNDLPTTLRSLKLDSLCKIEDQIPLFQLNGDFPTSLTELSLAGNILSENRLPSLPSSLTYLNLSAMKINNWGTPFFEESDLSRIKEFPFGSLVALNLSDNQLTDKSLQVIIHNPDSPLKVINLMSNRIAFEEIDLDTRFPRTLTRLNLKYNHIRRLDGLIALLLRQQQPISLKEIIITDNPLPLGDDVREQLKKNFTLLNGLLKW